MTTSGICPTLSGNTYLTSWYLDNLEGGFTLHLDMSSALKMVSSKDDDDDDF